MKKVISCFLSAVLVGLMMLPASAADEIVKYSEYLHLGFETDDEVALGTSVSQAVFELAQGGVFGSAGAARVTVSDASGYGAVQYAFSTQVRKNYNISVYLKPEDISYSTVKAIFYHGVVKDGATVNGGEEVTLKAGETTADGYTRYYFDGYKMDTMGRVYGAASANYPKTEDFNTTVEIRVSAQGTYLMDELKVEPVSDTIIEYDNFELATSHEANYVRQPANTDPWRSSVFSAVMTNNDNARYKTEDNNGFLSITGSQEQGAYFENVTLMPATTYRISAKVKNGSLTRGICALVETADGGGITSTKAYGPVSHYKNDNLWHEFEYYFRTKNVTGEAYSQTGFVATRVGVFCENGGVYETWMIDDLCLEVVDELPYNGDFSDDGEVGFAYNGETQVPAFFAGDKYTTITPVVDDGTNGDRGDYVKVSLVGGKSSDLGDDGKAMGTLRRLRAYVNLKQAQTYRLSFWMRLTEDSLIQEGTVSTMHDIGKVDDKYGYISIPDNTITTAWKHYSVDFTVQNAQKVGGLYIGIDSFAPEQDACFAIDEIVLEPIGAGYYDATLSQSDNVLTATEQTGAQIGDVLEKYYNFYVSNDGEHYAKAGTNSTGVFTLRESDYGKYMKSEVIATKADGSYVSAETAPIEVKRTGFTLAFNSTLEDEAVSATVTYDPQDGESLQFEAIIALYGADDALLGVAHETSIDNIATVSVANAAGAVKAKVFAWQTLESAIPLTASKELVAN